ncbi:oligosaccharide flippase family protein [Flagellimonas marinaquae]
MEIVWGFLKKRFGFLLTFTICKGLVFITPLLFAEVLGSEDFGVLEYALAGMGFVLNALFNLGVPGAYPYFMLKRKETSLKNGFCLHPVWLATIFIFQTILFYLDIIDQKAYLTLNIAFIISNQLFYSTKLKSHDNPIFAVLIDSGVYLVLFLAYTFSLMQLISLSISTISPIIIGYCLFYCLRSAWDYYRSEKREIFSNYLKILGYSKNLLIASFLIFLITSSGRIVTEWVFGFEKVGVYGYYFRLAAVVVMIHQVVNIAFFKKMYTVNPGILDKYFAIFFTAIYLLSLLFFWVSPFVLGDFSKYFVETYEDNRMIYLMVSCQMVLWIASALNSNIVDRENAVSANNYRFLMLIGVSFGILVLTKNLITFPMLAYFVYFVILISCFIQYYSLFKKGVRFYRSPLVLGLSAIVTSTIFFINL